MPSRAFRNFQALRGIRYAVALAIVLFVCLSRRGVAADLEVVPCESSAAVVSLALKETTKSVKFKCAQNSSLYPTVSDNNNKFCVDSMCRQEVDLGESYNLSQQPGATGSSHLKSLRTGESPTYTLTLTRQPEKSQTLYFLCKSTAAAPEEEREETAETSSDKSTSCIIQVAVYGAQALSDAASERVCTLGSSLEDVTLNSTSNKVTFRCGDGGTLSPVNFENAFAGEPCSTETSLATLGLRATLLEGKSASKDAAKVPAYTLEVSEFPAGPDSARVCYKCHQPSKQKDPAGDTTASECKVVINVAPDSETGDDKPDDDEPATSDATEHTGVNFVLSGVIVLTAALGLNEALMHFGGLGE
ncbi:SRS domain-containing protein [Neospora caninum Liverpool]|uniref:SRS domain-containing protein n=1 Tax=Neospora caninum (strain Liverpool) TaxID=572307 RepID=F0VLA4_NEOCL|nr:SRS domain-containing protein [Neospora caninum Liverpool]CBZ54856.1 SRS domain-containing protein [Neospora caninum Liverpool]CEL69576.1 TPA: SRS domain-containing protein [Neospora caninum Liverpool]|eukprot:XP_003884884.1 SRS domain-containing protein [Neospora caninum Liverpool]